MLGQSVIFSIWKLICMFFFFFFKQKTAYEIKCDWSSDVCSSDLVELSFAQRQLLAHLRQFYSEAEIARSEMQSLASSAEMATDSLRLTTLRYQAGESTVLEVVDAQNTLTLARNAYDDGQARFRVAVANLQTLTGTF